MYRLSFFVGLHNLAVLNFKLCVTFDSVVPFMKCVLCVLKNAHCKEPSKADVRFLKATIFVYLSYNYARAYTCATIRMHMTFVRIRTGAYMATGNIACL